MSNDFLRGYSIWECPTCHVRQQCPPLDADAQVSCTNWATPDDRCGTAMVRVSLVIHPGFQNPDSTVLTR